MIAHRRIIFARAAAVLTIVAAASPAATLGSPEAFLRRIYALDSGEVGALDSDPICGYCQDWCPLKEFSLGFGAAARHHVDARVHFTICGARKLSPSGSLRLRRVGGWPI